MSAESQPMIDKLRARLREQEEAVRVTMRTLNQLAAVEGEPLPYPEVDTTTSSISNLRKDQFYGVALATAIRQYLEMRKAANLGAASVNELYSALVMGGFKFDTKSEDNAKRGLYISLAKNAAVFHKVSSVTGEAAVFGLSEWYPSKRNRDEGTKKPKSSKSKPRAKSRSREASATGAKSEAQKALPAPKGQE